MTKKSDPGLRVVTAFPANRQYRAFYDTERNTSAERRLGVGTAARQAGLPTTTIRLDPADIAAARAQAPKKGLKYQSYLKMRVHEALVKADV